MEEIEETLKISIVHADYQTKRVIFSVCKENAAHPSFGIAKYNEESAPMWTFEIASLPIIHESTYKALCGDYFQDFFSLLFMQYHKFSIGVLYVVNECGNISFSVKPN